MDDIPSRPNRRKLTLGDFTSIVMTQIDQNDISLKPPSLQQGKVPDGK